MSAKTNSMFWIESVMEQGKSQPESECGLSWPCLLAFCLASGVIALLAAYTIESNPTAGGKFIPIALGSAAVVLMAGGLLQEHIRSLRLERKILRGAVILKLREDAEEVLDNIPAPILLVSSDFRIQLVNRSFLETFSLRNKDVMGWKLQDVLCSENLFPQVETILGHGGRLDGVPVSVSTVEGDQLWPCRLSIAPVPGEQEKDRALIMFTEVRHAESSSHPVAVRRL